MSKATLTKLNKLSLPAVILIVSFIIGGFYFVAEISKQKSIEKQQQVKIEQERLEQLKEQQAKEEAELLLKACLADAQINYSNQWYRECKSQGRLTSRCISLREMTIDEYKKQNPNKTGFEAAADFYEEKEDCSCSLPLANADRVNKALQDDKDECFRRYPQ